MIVVTELPESVASFESRWAVFCRGLSVLLTESRLTTQDETSFEDLKRGLIQVYDACVEMHSCDHPPMAVKHFVKYLSQMDHIVSMSDSERGDFRRQFMAAQRDFEAWVWRLSRSERRQRCVKIRWKKSGMQSWFLYPSFFLVAVGVFVVFGIRLYLNR